MDKELQIGKQNRLYIDEESEFGLFLKAEDEGRVLLPNAYREDFMKVGEELEVFLYSDSEDRLVATTQKPLAYLGEFCVAPIVDVAKFGTFVDIGLSKHLLIPKVLQLGKPKVGEKVLIYITLDKFDERLIGTQKTREYIKFCDKEYKQNQAVEILVASKTPMGYKVIIENQYEGLVFENEVFAHLDIGERREAYIKKQRKDGKLDISLQKVGVKHGNTNQNIILEKLQANGGKLAITSKSSPEVISRVFGMSKKAFKLALNKLHEDEKIEIKENGIIIA